MSLLQHGALMRDPSGKFNSAHGHPVHECIRRGEVALLRLLLSLGLDPWGTQQCTEYIEVHFLEWKAPKGNK